MSAQHDQIVKWIEDHMAQITARYLDPNWSDEERAQWSAHFSAPLPEPRITWKCAWEHPITVPTRHGHPPRIEGYIDLQAVVSRGYLYTENVEVAPEVQPSRPPVPLGLPGHVSGRPAQAVARVSVGNRREFWNFEAKTRIDSIGEVIRQIKKYRVFCPDHAKFFVVSPDASNAAIFEEQGIRFIEAFAGQGRLSI